MLSGVLSHRYPLWLVRVLRVSLFTVMIALSAHIRIPIPGTPVPITTQVLAVLLAGMTLGSVEGAASVVTYLVGIAVGLPIDASGAGVAALSGATGGYLFGFILGAFIAGLAWKAPERNKLWLNIGLGILAAVVIELVGMVGLYVFFMSAQHGASWVNAFALGVVPFILVDFGKALLAAALVNLGYRSWQRWLIPPVQHH